jgi:tetratricopeptide (TPR) repeat protein
MKNNVLLLSLLIGLIPIGIHAQTIDTLLQMDGYKLHFNIIEGNGMPLLFENGYGYTDDLWDGVAPEIASVTGAPLIRYDRQGFGGSTIDLNNTGIESEITGLEKALKKLGYDKDFFLVAHSMGAFYSSIFAANNPNTSKGIVFFDGSLACFFTPEQIVKNPHAELLTEIVAAVKHNPLPLNIPLFDVVAGKSIEDYPRWGVCHNEFVKESPERKGIIAYGSGHYIFLDNSELAINVVVTNYANTQIEVKKSLIIEKGYAFEQNEVNKSYGELVKYNHSAKDFYTWGSSVIKQNETTKALKIFRFNTSLYPENTTAFQGLGEAFLKIGQIDSSKLYFQKSYMLDSTNTKSQEALKKISEIKRLPSKVLTTYVGNYSCNGVVLTIKKEKDMLSLDLVGDVSVMCFTSKASFYLAYHDGNFEFTKDKNGSIDGFNFDDKKAVKIK